MTNRPALLVVSLLALHAAAARRPVLAVLPLSGEDAVGVDVGALAQAKASRLLTATGLYSELHSKQINAYLAGEGIPEQQAADPRLADGVLRGLGAERGVAARVLTGPRGFRLVGYVRGGKDKTKALSTELGADLGKAVELAATTIAKAVLAFDGAQGKLKPLGDETSDSAVLKPWSHCLEAVTRQPMGIENPSVLNAAELDAAVASCREALAKKPDFVPASAALALALAIEGNDQEALGVLAGIAGRSEELPLYWIARFWLVTRYQSNEAGLGVLDEALAKHPELLIFHGYKGELLDTLNRPKEALAAWAAYQALAPEALFPQTRAAKEKARLGDTAGALADTRAALALMPTSRDGRLQLASRHIDAKQYDEAIAQLDGLSKEPNPSGEVFVRLGYAQLQKGDVGAAEPSFKEAIAHATAPGEWRTRGRAWYDVALLAARRGDQEGAREALINAYGTGYRPRQLDPSLKEAARAADRAAMSGDPSSASATGSGTTAKTGVPLPPIASPFAITREGEQDFARPKPPPPDNFGPLRFNGAARSPFDTNPLSPLK